MIKLPTTPSFLQNLSIRTRLAIGFGLVICCFLFLGIITHFKLSYLSNSLLEVRSITEQTAHITRVNRTVLELQRQVVLYIYTGQKAYAQRVQELSTSIDEELHQLLPQSIDITVHSYLERMLEHLNGYMKNFSEVSRERSLQSNIVNFSMPSFSNKVQESYIDLEKKLLLSNRSSEAATVISSLNHFLYSQGFVNKFFNDPDSSLVNLAKLNLNKAQEKLANLPKRSDTKQLILVTKEALNEYEASFIRAVQAQRGYLFLVNVVMAGEASEFSYNANQLYDYISNKVHQIEATAYTNLSASILLNIFLFALALFISGLFSFLISKSILTPLDKITKTFTRLSKGDKQANIPGLNRKDEIGQMAQAADVFKERNHETEKLLIEFQELSVELDEKKQALEKSNHEMEQFVYTVSHDLKSPIVSSMGFIGMIRDLAKKGDYDRAFDKIERLENSNLRMRVLISDLLDLSRIGRADLELENLDMKNVLDEVYDQLAQKFSEYGFIVDIPEKLPDLYANRSCTIQIFDNILNNAIKYCSNIKTPRIQIHGQVKGDEIHYGIQDNGPGIPPEYHKKIFGLFQRLDNKTEGTGIGLSIVSKIMESHQGRVWVESDIGKGTTFWLAYPAKTLETAQQKN